MLRDSFRRPSGVVIAELQNAPSRPEVQKAFRRLRGEHRMPGAKQARMSKLLAKANERSLSAEESEELDRLVQEYEERTLELVREVRMSVTSSPRNGPSARAIATSEQLGARPAAVRRAVFERARDTCEYCRLQQAYTAATFEVDHVLPCVAGGDSSLENCCPACPNCNAAKQSQTSAVDPSSGRRVALFHPRTQQSSRHFRWSEDFGEFSADSRHPTAASSIGPASAIVLPAPDILLSP